MALVGWLVGWSAVSLVSLVVGWYVSLLVGSFVGYLYVCWSVGWLFTWSVDVRFQVNLCKENKSRIKIELVICKIKHLVKNYNFVLVHRCTHLFFFTSRNEYILK